MLEMREQRSVVNRFKLLFFHSSIMTPVPRTNSFANSVTISEQRVLRRPFHSFTSTTKRGNTESATSSISGPTAAIPVEEDESEDNRMQKIRHRVRAMSLDLIGKKNSPATEQASIRGPLSPSFLEIKSIDIARELTMDEFELYCVVEPREFLGQAWQKDNKMEIAPNLTRLIENFNKIGYWVATEVLTKQDIKVRLKYIKKFIKIAYKCYECNNFNGVMQILSGLNNSSVKRLKVGKTKI